jgi:branched-chain amino acid transport system permease protein
MQAMQAVLRALTDSTADRIRALSFDQRMALGLFGAIALLPIAGPLLGGSYPLHIGERILILALAAISLELLIGVGGLVSFGHAAFLGIGAYAAGIAASHGYGTLSVALPAALAISAAFALLTGAIAVRTHGVYFIMISLAFGQMAFFVATSLAPYGGDDGLGFPGRTLVFGSPILKTEAVFFYFTLAAAIAAYVLVRRLIGSRFGRVLRGLTGSEARMEAIGFAPYPYRLTAYVIAGTLCGCAGFLLGNHAEFVSPAYMHWTRSGELIVMVLLGGTGTVYGPLLGAFAFVLLEETLAGYTEHWKAILGPILVLVVLFARGGLAGAIEQWRRTRTTPAEALDALAAVARLRAEKWRAAAARRREDAATLVARGRDAMVPVVAHAAAEAGARWGRWRTRARRRIDPMRPAAERRIARLCEIGHGLQLGASRHVARLALFAKGAIAEARARWHPCKRALGRQLVSLAILAERGLAEATEWWRRR